MPVYSPSFLPDTHSRLPTEGGPRLSRLGCLVLCRGGLPVQIQSPTQALTGPGIENYDDQVQRVPTTLNRQPAVCPLVGVCLPMWDNEIFMGAIYVKSSDEFENGCIPTLALRCRGSHLTSLDILFIIKIRKTITTTELFLLKHVALLS